MARKYNHHIPSSITFKRRQAPCVSEQSRVRGTPACSSRSQSPYCLERYSGEMVRDGEMVRGGGGGQVTLVGYQTGKLAIQSDL